MKVVVVIPTYNEAENLPKLVEQLLSLRIEGLELLVVDDSSPDGTGELADELARTKPVEVIHRAGKMGFASAYLTGFRRAIEDGADVVIEMDADLSHSPHYLPEMLEKLRDNDVVIGSRYAAGGGADPRWGWRRKFMSAAGNRYARWVTGLRMKDVTGGFRAYRREVLSKLDLQAVQSKGYAFQIEMAYACQKHGFRVAEVPITFQQRDSGSSKMSWAIFWEALWRVWQLRLRRS